MILQTINYEPKRIMTSEKNLWAAVMEESFRDLNLPEELEGKRYTPKRDWKETVDWFFSEEEYIGSFRFVASILDLDPDAILSGLEKLRCKVCKKQTLYHYPCYQGSFNKKYDLEGRKKAS